MFSTAIIRNEGQVVFPPRDAEFIRFSRRPDVTSTFLNTPPSSRYYCHPVSFSRHRQTLTYHNTIRSPASSPMFTTPFLARH